MKKRLLSLALAMMLCLGLAVAGKKGSDGNRKYGFINKTGAVVMPLECDNAEIVVDSYYSDDLCRVQKGASYGVFESPCYEPPKETKRTY